VISNVSQFNAPNKEHLEMLFSEFVRTSMNRGRPDGQNTYNQEDMLEDDGDDFFLYF
jgi:hypothetical protein